MALATIISGVTAAIGIGASLFGASRQRDAQRQQEALQRQNLQTQQAIEAQRLQVFNQQAAVINQAQENIQAASLRQEEARQRQARLEAQRARRSTIRQAIIARGTSASEAANAGIGSLFGGSSITSGAQAGIFNEAAFQNLGSFQTQDIGETIFAENRNIFDAQRQQNQAQALIDQANANARFSSATSQRQAQLAGIGLSGAGQGFSQFGTALTRNAPTIGKIGATLFKGSSRSTSPQGIPLPTRNPLR